MIKRLPLFGAVLFGGGYVLTALLFQQPDFILFKLGLVGFPIFLVQMIGWTLFGLAGQIALTTALLSFIGWLIGLTFRKLIS